MSLYTDTIKLQEYLPDKVITKTCSKNSKLKKLKDYLIELYIESNECQYHQKSHSFGKKWGSYD